MSVFQVRLVRNVGAGYVTDPSKLAAAINYLPVEPSGTAGTIPIGASAQRTMDVTGPNLTRRRLYDGETFTSTNYWKRFAPVSEGGTLTEESAFIHIISDDGTPWSDKDKGLNKFAKVNVLDVVAGTCYSTVANQLDFMALYGAVATYVQITTDQDIKVLLNSSTEAEMDLDSGTHWFDNGDLPLTSLAFCNTESGVTDATVEVVSTLEIISND